ncbi:hypothetical protein chiPu_0014003 [Chiloscyllium punctatum]|uniref:Uncharacterized protein n=1 Tax=Chiloscyllium punctatum TaxID=137246 RepID=A0A401SYQ0_CHIPU|nr:hypothetical protein [Chiloscyllium punctatum]
MADVLMPRLDEVTASRKLPKRSPGTHGHVIATEIHELPSNVCSRKGANIFQILTLMATLRDQQPPHEIRLRTRKKESRQRQDNIYTRGPKIPSQWPPPQGLLNHR